MAELTVEQVIKLIIGIIVVVVVVAGIYLLFKNNILEFINGISSGKPEEIILPLI